MLKAERRRLIWSRLRQPGLSDANRGVILRASIRVIALATTAAIPLTASLSFFGVISWRENHLLQIALLMAPVYLLILAFEKKIPYAIQVAVPLLLGVATAIFDYVESGLVGPALLTMTMMAVVALILANTRTAVLLVGAGISLHLLFSILISRGMVTPVHQIEILTGSWWLTISVRFAITLAVINVLTYYYVENTNRLLQRQQVLVEEVHGRRTRKARQVRQRTAALELTTEIARSMSAILNQDTLVQNIVDQIKLAFGYDHVAIDLTDPAGGIQANAGDSAAGGQLTGEELPPRERVVDRCARLGRSVLVADVLADPTLIPHPHQAGTHAELAVPIISDQRLIGVLDAIQAKVGGLDDGDLKLLELVSLQIGPALENARQFERTQAEAQKEHQMNWIAERIRLAPDIHTLMRITAEAIGQRFGVASVEIQIDPNALEAIIPGAD